MSINHFLCSVEGSVMSFTDNNVFLSHVITFIGNWEQVDFIYFVILAMCILNCIAQSEGTVFGCNSV